MNWGNYHFLGMHLIWWILWLALLIWFFASRLKFPKQKLLNNSPIDILKKRLALGEIENAEYVEKKALLEKN